MTGLGTLGGIVSKARAVNGNGDIVGGSNGDVFVVDNGKMTDLGSGEAFGINGLGEIAGSTSCCHAFLISGGRRTTLRDLSSYAGSDNGQGCGPAVMGSNGTITGLGTLGGTQSAAYEINDLGQVTGWAHTAREATRVFLWSGGTMTGPETFALDPAGEAINNHGVILGQSGLGAWFWSGGMFQNLSNLISPGSRFRPGNATAISDNGQVAADGDNSAGQEHAFLLAPTRASLARKMSPCAVGLVGGSGHASGYPALCGAVCDPKGWGMARTRWRRTLGTPDSCPRLGRSDRQRRVPLAPPAQDHPRPPPARARASRIAPRRLSRAAPQRRCPPPPREFPSPAIKLRLLWHLPPAGAGHRSVSAGLNPRDP
jgi:probable HAF family extracellular repeat protein